MTERTKQVLKAAKAPTKRPKEEKAQRCLSSGSTLLNLACTNTPTGAFVEGKYIFFVGDSASGKTFLSMSCFAEAARHSHFKNFRFIYDNVEDGCLIDLPALFGEKVAQKIEPPTKDEAGVPVYSSTVEEFYYHLHDALEQSKKEKRPFIYVLDSMDGLSSVAEEEKFLQHKEAFEKGKTAAGSYGDGKAKKNSEGLRKALKGLRETGSILIIISQTRDNLGMGFETKTRSGGRALRFYATLEIWMSLCGKIKKNIRGKDRTIGVQAKIQIKKNRLTGEAHEVVMDIYPSYGIDDIGGCIDYLVQESWWEKKKNSIVATEFGVTLTREKLIATIEESSESIAKLQTITAECWNAIRNAGKLNRKKRYAEDVDFN
jgi:RecA/RadA recombinase